ncbi:basic salivary proline-rich protein 2-like [Prinia subflava]|uniref:basic salivary proline-rich protein 2-like n=1 Tax=Prinia subflava TaxID=208062 RepID=UPI002FDF1D31
MASSALCVPNSGARRGLPLLFVQAGASSPLPKPPGRARQPPGRARQPPGRARQPPGRARQPPGRARQPPGRARQPPGRARQPPGRARQPPGRARQPPRPARPRSPSGPQARSPSGPQPLRPSAPPRVPLRAVPPRAGAGSSRGAGSGYLAAQVWKQASPRSPTGADRPPLPALPKINAPAPVARL